MGIKKETGEKRQFDTGAKRQHAEGKGTPVLFPGDAYLDVCKHFEDGAIHYGGRNWEKGLPLSTYIDSLERHIAQEKMGLTDESHDRAIAWNAICYLATKLRIAAGILPAELNDMPRYVIKSVKETPNSDKFKIEKNSLGWYIYRKNSTGYYLHKDLIMRKWIIDEDVGSAVYYRTKELAEETLQAYLDKERR